jgi:hypothetical protein
MASETWPAVVDPAGTAIWSSTDAPLRRSPGGGAFIQELLEHARRGTTLARPLTAGDICQSRLMRTPDASRIPPFSASLSRQILERTC